MVNVDTVYQAVLTLTNKFQGGGYLSPDEFNTFANIANLELMDEYFSSFQNTQKLTDSIKTFISTKTLMIDELGMMQYPSDYYFFAAMRTYKLEDYLAVKTKCEKNNTPINYRGIRQVNIKVIDNDKLGSLMSSDLFAPNEQYPVAIFYGDYIQIYPLNLGIGILDYLFKPPAVNWGFTISGSTGLPIYNPETSTDFMWDDINQNSLIMKISRLLGVQIRETDLVQLTDGLDKQGI